MNIKIHIAFFLILFSFFLFSNDNKPTLLIEKFEISGLRFAKKRVEKELVFKKDDVWDKNKVVNYLENLKKEDIIESFEIIEQNSEKEGYVKIKIKIEEKLPFFAFLLPFYSTSVGFKIKVKYWQFFIDGYKTSMEGQLEYIGKENLNVFVRTNDPIVLNDKISIAFDFNAYTSTLNYISTLTEWHNNTWGSGIENLYFKIFQKIPSYNAKLNYTFGFGYGNIITTDLTYDITTIKDQDHIFLLNPIFDLEIPIKLIEAKIKSQIGLGYKNLYSKTKESLNYSKNEINISNFGNNPRTPKESLLNPVNIFSFEVPFTKPESRLFFGIDFALKNSFNHYGDGKIYDNILIKEFDYSTFENIILKSIEKESDKEFFNSKYNRDTDKAKYIIKENLSETDKEKLWDILIDIGYISNNGVYTSPNIGWTFYFYKKNISLTPSFRFSYKNRWESLENVFNEINIIPSLDFNYNIPIINALFKIKLEISYNRNWNNYYTDKIYINKINFSFEKKFKFDEKYLENQKITEDNKKRAINEIKINFNIYADPIFTYDSRFGSLPALNNFKTLFEALYQLYLPVYKDHRYKMKVLFFSTYNSKTDKLFNEVLIGKYLRGKGWSYFGGYVGLILNLEYWLPLFTINMSKIFNKSFDKDFEWQMFWVFYIDAGVALTDKETEFTLDRNLMHILPALVVGTAFKIYPKFIPLVVNIEVNFNAYNLIKNQGGLTSYIFFEFSVSRAIE